MNLAKKFVPVMINIDKDSASASKYSVGSIPAIMFLDGKGKVVHSLVGFVSPDEFVREMQTALTKAKKK